MVKAARTPDARERILETAARLFNRDGIHAVGVDTLVAEAGVAKMTLYHHFKSKDDLIVAWLERRDAEWRSAYEAALARSAAPPAERLLLVFDLLGKWFKTDDFRGCNFLNTAAELPDPGHAGRRIVWAHKRQLADTLKRLAREAGARAPGALSAQLLLLVEGAIVTAAIDPESRPARRAKDAARVLLAAEIPARDG